MSSETPPKGKGKLLGFASRTTTPKTGSAAASPKGPASPRSPPEAAGAPEHLEAEIHEDDGNGDADSAYGSSIASDTTSLASSIARYRFENGRTYHSYKEGSYILPNDEQENNRLDMQHHLALLTFDNKLFTAPIDPGSLHRVLDAGTGTGIWAIDFADENPDCQVVGVDLSPIQPEFVPTNVKFYVDDLEAEWTYNTPFDFIYMRMLAGSISDWDKLFRQSLRHLQPGGWIELCDPIYPFTSDDGTLKEDSYLYQWSHLMNVAAKKMGHGRSLETAMHYKDQLERAGFTNITETHYKWPINTWPRDPKYKELGLWAVENLLDGVEGLSMALFTRFLGWSAEAVRVFLIDVRKDLKRRDIHSYVKLWVVTAQKPEED